MPFEIPLEIVRKTITQIEGKGNKNPKSGAQDTSGSITFSPSFSHTILQKADGLREENCRLPLLSIDTIVTCRYIFGRLDGFVLWDQVLNGRGFKNDQMDLCVFHQLVGDVC